jgi:hypothetical protein
VILDSQALRIARYGPPQAGDAETPIVIGPVRDRLLLDVDVPETSADSTSDGVSEESTDVYIIDVSIGHCGDKPQATWIDVTQATLDADTVGMWILGGQSL